MRTCQVFLGHLASYSCLIVVRVAPCSFLVTMKLRCTVVNSFTMMKVQSEIFHQKCVQQGKNEAAKVMEGRDCSPQGVEQA